MLIKGIWKTRCFVVSRKDFIYSFPSISNIEFVSVECRFKKKLLSYTNASLYYFIIYMFEDLCKVFRILSIPDLLISIFCTDYHKIGLILICHIIYVIHLDFLCLYWLNLTNVPVMCFFWQFQYLGPYGMIYSVKALCYVTRTYTC